MAVPFAIIPSHPFPLGASLIEGGVNFAVFSSAADAIDLCLFDPEDLSREIARVRLTRKGGTVWHVALSGIGVGQPYGFRVYEPYDLSRGLRFAPQKLLLDPYAKSVVGTPDWNPEMAVSFPDDPPEGDQLDNGATALKSVVIDPAFNWEGVRPPRVPWRNTVIYETHVKGFTALRPSVPEKLRGTYAGLAHETVTAYFKDLGVTAVQLLPVHQHLDDGFLLHKGLTNYWGYNTIGFFAPHNAYAHATDPQGQINEFKGMVKAFHREGIEVILDVVYNHTGEGNELWPTLLFRGFDNAAYYKLAANKQHYENYTGTGNSVNVSHNRVLQLVIDSLRYWVEEMHIDGFRFDLATTVGRGKSDFDPQGDFFNAVRRDPILARVKLIAEPWDIGWGGFQLGKFPAGWAELNGYYRDGVRQFWRGDANVGPDMASRFTGSQNLFWQRGPWASINFVTSHDGFTLRDLVSYNGKHNFANGEENRDGDDNNHSYNYGVEGETDDEEINATRRRQQRNILATLFFSTGVPLITGGDEFGRTQGGNNNAYCQDNEISWLGWDHSDEAKNLHAFVRTVVRLRARHSTLRRCDFFRGKFLPGRRFRDIVWYDAGGRVMTNEKWSQPDLRQIGVQISGAGQELGEPADGTFFFAMNAADETVDFFLPGLRRVIWRLLIDTAEETGLPAHEEHFQGGDWIRLPGRALSLLQLEIGTDEDAQKATARRS